MDQYVTIADNVITSYHPILHPINHTERALPWTQAPPFRLRLLTSTIRPLAQSVGTTTCTARQTTGCSTSPWLVCHLPRFLRDAFHLNELPLEGLKLRPRNYIILNMQVQDDRKYTGIPHSSVYVSSNLEEEVVSRKCKVSTGFQADASLL